MGFRREPGDPFAALFGALAEGPDGPRHRPPPVETEHPAIDVFETPDELVIEAELPGTDPAQIGVSIGEGLVLVEGAKDDPGPGRVNYLCMERSFGPFRRTVATGRAVDAARATATYRDGILQVRLPKIEEKRGRCRVIPVTTPAEPKEEGQP
jgi:HSP20 family protein